MAPVTIRFFVSVSWPIRPNIEPFQCEIQSKHNTKASISFPAKYEIPPDIVLAGITWTRIDFEWTQPFEGGPLAAYAWSKSARGSEKLLSMAEEYSAILVDSLRALHPQDRNLAGLRSFGVRDWPHYEFGVEGFPKTTRVGVHAEQQFRSVATQLFEGAEISLIKSGSFSVRGLLRASDLAEGGYPTEAVLIAFGALDVSVQSFLNKKMQLKGVAKDAAEAMLRNITTKRLNTYLDSVLMLACGKSITDTPHLAKAIASANKARNDAIHNGLELSRGEAVTIIQSIADTFEYLKAIDSEFEPEYLRPSFFC